MSRLNVHEAKTHFSHYIQLVEEGETFLICRRHEPVAKLVPAPQKEKRPIGLASGQVEIPDSFFDPLPDDVIESFYGSKDES